MSPTSPRNPMTHWCCFGLHIPHPPNFYISVQILLSPNPSSVHTVLHVYNIQDYKFISAFSPLSITLRAVFVSRTIIMYLLYY